MKGPYAEECQQPLADGKGKEMDSPLEPTEGMRPHGHLGLNPVRLISNGFLTSQTVR